MEASTARIAVVDMLLDLNSYILVHSYRITD